MCPCAYARTPAPGSESSCLQSKTTSDGSPRARASSSTETSVREFMFRVDHIAARSGTRSLASLPGRTANAQARHAAVQRGGIHPQDLGRPADPAHTPAGALEHGEDVVRLHLG